MSFVTRVMKSSDPSCQHHILSHEGDPFTMQRTQVAVFEQSYHVVLSCNLQHLQCYGGPAQLLFGDVVSHLLNYLLERTLLN